MYTTVHRDPIGNGILAQYFHCYGIHRNFGMALWFACGSTVYAYVHVAELAEQWTSNPVVTWVRIPSEAAQCFFHCLPSDFPSLLSFLVYFPLCIYRYEIDHVHVHVQHIYNIHSAIHVVQVLFLLYMFTCCITCVHAVLHAVVHVYMLYYMLYTCTCCNNVASVHACM